MQVSGSNVSNVPPPFGFRSVPNSVFSRCQPSGETPRTRIDYVVFQVFPAIWRCLAASLCLELSRLEGRGRNVGRAATHVSFPCVAGLVGCFLGGAGGSAGYPSGSGGNASRSGRYPSSFSGNVSRVVGAASSEVDGCCESGGRRMLRVLRSQGVLRRACLVCGFRLGPHCSATMWTTCVHCR